MTCEIIETCENWIFDLSMQVSLNSEFREFLQNCEPGKRIKATFTIMKD